MACWDWLFGSLHHSIEFDNLELGIEKNQNEQSHSLKNLYLNPFVEIKVFIFKKIIRTKNKIVEQFSKRRIINDN